ncbi:MAG: hypothetical protein IK077_16700 [Thermoguttaceae bacterium]|nr:hypothetical protein [Thermoguttaceae bacterium]
MDDNGLFNDDSIPNSCGGNYLMEVSPFDSDSTFNGTFGASTNDSFFNTSSNYGYSSYSSGSSNSGYGSRTSFFRNNKRTLLIVGITIVVIVVGALAYFFRPYTVDAIGTRDVVVNFRIGAQVVGEHNVIVGRVSKVVYNDRRSGEDYIRLKIDRRSIPRGDCSFVAVQTNGNYGVKIEGGTPYANPLPNGSRVALEERKTAGTVIKKGTEFVKDATNVAKGWWNAAKRFINGSSDSN